MDALGRRLATLETAGIGRRNRQEEVIRMSKDLIMEALSNDELRKQLLEDLEVEELEERVAAKPWICFRPAW